ncbi:hypothetical protein [Actinomadura terrae]|uniref:hypothetical protein n=1 Tax=Actinomadura terrae TaxID=604353 RepID=UPI001FA6AC40|nr:hypothetical protein [Actinomadura terrae]
MTPEFIFFAALSAYQRGDHRKAGQYAKQALNGHLPDGALTVRVIHLYLTSTELLWMLAPSDEIGALVTRAEQAAECAGDPAACAIAHNLRGQYLVANNDLHSGLLAFAEAARLAEGSMNLLAEIQAFSDLGHNMIGSDLSRGVAILHQAHAFVAGQDLSDIPVTDRAMARVLQARLAGFIGVAAFDSGRFDEAESWLRRSASQLHTANALGHFALISNFLGQLLMTIGRFEDAEAVLHKALRLLLADFDLGTYQGYNLGLLGKLYLEWGKLDSAESAIKAGWDRLQRTQNKAIMPIVRNYLGELYAAPSYPHHDLSKATALFNETITECRRTGFQRSEIAAQALLALANLRAADTAGALAASAAAVERLAQTGTMPSLRTEEIYFARYQVMHAIGSYEEAAMWLDRAKDVLLAKAVTIESLEARQKFLYRVQTSRSILTAV